MVNIILKSLVGGIIATAGIEVIYGVENKGVLGFINLAIFLGFFLMMKNEIDEKKEEDKLAKKEFEAFKRNIINEIKEVSKEVKNREILESVLAEVKNREVVDNILVELKDRKILNDILTEVKNRKVFDDMLVEIKNREALENILNELKNKNVFEDILEEIKNREDLEDIKEGIAEFKKESLKRLDGTGKKVEKFNKDVISNIIDLTGVTEESVEKYDEIKKEIVKEFLELAERNENNTNLIRDSYKVLNALVDNR